VAGESATFQLKKTGMHQTSPKAQNGDFLRNSWKEFDYISVTCE
jgi:hypothetical protein